LDGKIAGTWKRSLARERVIIEARPFTPISTTQARKIAAAAERYAAFLGLSCGAGNPARSRLSAG
jgi:hypothetical protein